MVCDVCGKETDFIGLQLSFTPNEADRPKMIAAVAPYPLKDYNICYSCRLKSLGVKTLDAWDKMPKEEAIHG